MRLDCFSAVRLALEHFERARSSPRAVAVTALARRIASPRSHGSGAAVGMRAHSVWGDPFEACSRSEYWTPLPLAREVEEVWVYGVADLVRFQQGIPVEVVELKSYDEPDEYSLAQARLYAWLVAGCFGVAPRAYVVLGWDGQRFSQALEVPYAVERVEAEVKGALVRMGLLSGR